MNLRRIFGRWFPVLGLLAAPGAELWACAACFGQSDSSMAKGMNMGIFTLLLVITCVLASIAGFFVYLVRRNSHADEVGQMQSFAKQLTENRTNA